jgi:hypothetical protein
MLIVTIGNVSKLAPVSDYEWSVWVANDNGKVLVAQGSVKGHRRSDGWAALVKKVAEAGEAQR